MFELRAGERVVLLLPSGMDDGEMRFETVAADAVVLWSSGETRPATPPRTDARGELLLRSPRPPVAGSRIRWRGREWELGSVRVCRDLDGRLICCRCTLI